VNRAAVPCAGCDHIYALHNASGCRINGCRCPEFTAVAVEPAPSHDDEPRGGRDWRLVAGFVGTGVLTFVAGLIAGANL
jgi:hypothetical protein